MANKSAVGLIGKREWAAWLILASAFGVKRFVARTAPPPDEEGFGVWGESARSRQKNLRRVKRR